MSILPSVLMVDDDTSHLQIYSLILEGAGCRVATALVGAGSFEPPVDPDIALVILNYRLAGELSAAEVARKLQRAYPGTPILVLSDLYGMPADMAPFAVRFVRKGEPEQLVATVKELLSGRPGPQAEKEQQQFPGAMGAQRRM